MKDDYEGHWWETYLTLDEWAQMPSGRRMWCDSDTSLEAEERHRVGHEMGLVAQTFLLSSLTPRQRQVVELYYLEGKTQVEVAQILGISQQTVSQHLKGKLRRGSYVGGAIRKIQKAIQKAAKNRAGEESRYAQILEAFVKLLDPSITRRQVHELTGSLARTGRWKSF
jgi:predicted transcriptional regulator